MRDLLFGVLSIPQQSSLQIYLKSKNGPIEVYLCPEEGLEDVSPVKNAITPKKEFPEPLGPPSTNQMVQTSFSVKEEPIEGKLGSLGAGWRIELADESCYGPLRQLVAH